jgi:tetratricopeptide (TPR) repeat protein
MAKQQSSAADRHKADRHKAQGLEAYKEWDIDQAIKCLQSATRLVPDEPDYQLHLARALARSGDFDQALHALAEFMRLEPDSPLANRFERLFASGMDKVELALTDKMTQAGMPLEEIGAAIQMWLEYQIALGRETLTVRKSDTWAAALDYTVRKVNLRPVKRQAIADLYGVSEEAIQGHHDDLIRTLDVMPCDYRYFKSPENPLDKLVEAAELLEQLETRFRKS